MLLARGAARQRELAIRAALGSGRTRIMRQLLTESLLLALAGGGLGVLLAAWGVDGLVALAPRTIPRLDEVRLDRAVLLFALAISVASGVLGGLRQAPPGARGEPPGRAGRGAHQRGSARPQLPGGAQLRRRGRTEAASRGRAGCGGRLGLARLRGDAGHSAPAGPRPGRDGHGD